MLLAFALAQAISPDMAPVDMYKQAMKVMRSIAAPAYLQYDVHEETAERGKVVAKRLEVSERTGDRATMARNLADKTAKPRPVDLTIYPDIFLGHGAAPLPTPAPRAFSLGLDNEPEKNLKVIGVVSAVHYDVSNAGAEELPGCSAAIHLKLQPRTNPLVYNLRDLWVDPRTSQICQAIAVWNAPVGFTRQNVAVTLNVDAAGFISHWNASATAHYIFGQSAMQQQASYTDFRSVDESVWATLSQQ